MGSKGGGGQRTSQDPWAGTIPYLHDLYSEGSRLYFRTPQEQYVQQFAGPGEASTQAMQMMAQRAQDPNLTTQAQGLLSDTISGKYLGESNPYLQQQAGKIQSQLASQFAKSGRYGGGVHQAAQGEALANLAAQTYGQERSRQMQAMQMAPQMAFADISPLMKLGGLQEQYAQRALQEQQAQEKFAQMAPWERLQRYQQMVIGSNAGGGTTTQQAMGGTSTAAGALGGAATGAAMGSVIPGIGTAIGAVAGGLMGAMG